MSWSGGKDASAALHLLLKDPTYEVIELHTAISSEHQRVSMHGIDKSLIEAQAKSIGIPLVFIQINPDASNASYEAALNTYYETLVDRAITHIGFGDIFLADLKIYREQLMAKFNLTGVYPLWQQNTSVLASQFIKDGFKTVICASNKALFNPSICGKNYTQQLIQALNDEIDPCGENGEFHSFTYAGPIFRKEIPISRGNISTHTYHYCGSDGTKIETSFQFCDIQIISED